MKNQEANKENMKNDDIEKHPLFKCGTNRSAYWIDKKGFVHSIKHMEDDYVRNVIKFLLKTKYVKWVQQTEFISKRHLQYNPSLKYLQKEWASRGYEEIKLTDDEEANVVFVNIGAPEPSGLDIDVDMEFNWSSREDEYEYEDWWDVHENW